jgi:hypothetical protein
VALCSPAFGQSPPAEQGWDGLKNGELIRVAKDARFDVLLTSAKGFPHQQNLSGWKLAVAELSAEELEYYQGLFA